METGGQVARVLVADDHPLVREAVSTILRRYGLEVVGQAASGTEALALVRETHPDVVVLDLQMPDMDGLEATRRIKEEFPRTAVIIYTAFGEPESLREALLAGAAGYITKGMPARSIYDAVQAVLSGGTIADPALLTSAFQGAARWGRGGRADERARIASLSPRERQVLVLIVEGLSNAEIADRIHFSTGTVKNTVQRIMEKLGVSDRTQAALFAVRSGLMD